MPEPTEKPGTTQFTPERLKEYANSDGYFPGMHRESIVSRGVLITYDTEGGKMRAGNPNFGPAKSLQDAWNAACASAVREFDFNIPMLMSFTQTMLGNHSTFEEIEERNLENNVALGKVMGKDLAGRMPNQNNPSGGNNGGGNGGGGGNNGGGGGGGGNNNPKNSEA